MKTLYHFTQRKHPSRLAVEKIVSQAREIRVEGWNFIKISYKTGSNIKQNTCIFPFYLIYFDNRNNNHTLQKAVITLYAMYRPAVH